MPTGSSAVCMGTRVQAYEHNGTRSSWMQHFANRRRCGSSPGLMSFWFTHQRSENTAGACSDISQRAQPLCPGTPPQEDEWRRELDAEMARRLGLSSPTGPPPGQGAQGQAGELPPDMEQQQRR